MRTKDVIRKELETIDNWNSKDFETYYLEDVGYLLGLVTVKEKENNNLIKFYYKRIYDLEWQYTRQVCITCGLCFFIVVSLVVYFVRG